VKLLRQRLGGTMGNPILDQSMTDKEIFAAIERELRDAKLAVGLSGKGFSALDNAQTYVEKLRRQQQGW
jgi:hypothetical protein